MNDHKGARLLLEALPAGSTLIADRGYASNWFRQDLAEKDITPCIQQRQIKNANHDCQCEHCGGRGSKGPLSIVAVHGFILA
jgi:IS5 family transposase